MGGMLLDEVEMVVHAKVDVFEEAIDVTIMVVMMPLLLAALR
jgi:hypothetical protein